MLFGEVPFSVVNDQRYALRAAIELLQLANFDHLSEDQASLALEYEHRLRHAIAVSLHNLVDATYIEATLTLDNLISKHPKKTLEVLGTRKQELDVTMSKFRDRVSSTRGRSDDALSFDYLSSEEFDELVHALVYIRRDLTPEVLASSKLRNQSQFAASISVVIGTAATVAALITWLFG